MIAISKVTICRNQVPAKGVRVALEDNGFFQSGFTSIILFSVVVLIGCSKNEINCELHSPVLFDQHVSEVKSTRQIFLANPTGVNCSKYHEAVNKLEKVTDDFIDLSPSCPGINIDSIITVHTETTYGFSDEAIMAIQPIAQEMINLSMIYVEDMSEINCQNLKVAAQATLQKAQAYNSCEASTNMETFIYSSQEILDSLGC